VRRIVHRRRHVLVQYNNYKHAEIESLTGEIGTLSRTTVFFTRDCSISESRQALGPLWFLGNASRFLRDGEEALAPPTTQNCLRGLWTRNVGLRTSVVQFGGRVETNRYNPNRPMRAAFCRADVHRLLGRGRHPRSHVEGGAFVANYSHSYRAPSLEELYNLGPHRGNLAFEIGNPELTRELGDSIDFGVRHSSKRLRFEANGFYYHMRDFVFLAPTGAVEDGLIVADYDQANARFMGTEAKFETALHSAIWLNMSLDYVNAELTTDNTPLPRIPPLRGRVGLEFRYKGLLLNPEVVMSNHQDRIFPTETSTAGFALFNLSGSYLLTHGHAAHILSFNFFNIGDTVYRNHLSFIKDFAPEMGRGLRMTYTLRFF
jgi:iron complex outermembrane receptor protein